MLCRKPRCRLCLEMRRKSLYPSCCRLNGREKKTFHDVGASNACYRGSSYPLQSVRHLPESACLWIVRLFVTLGTGIKVRSPSSLESRVNLPATLSPPFSLPYFEKERQPKEKTHTLTRRLGILTASCHPHRYFKEPISSYVRLGICAVVYF